MSAFALACNVLEVLERGVKAINLCRKIYKEGTPNADIAESVKNFMLASQKLQDQLRPFGDQLVLINDDDDLYDFTLQCHKAAKELNDELERLRILDQT